MHNWNSSRNRRRKRKPSYRMEKPKDHEALPDTLETGYREARDDSGQLTVYLRDQPEVRIVLGKWLAEQKDGSMYYVAYYGKSPLTPEALHRIDHLLLAIAQVHEIISEFERKEE